MTTSPTMVGAVLPSPGLARVGAFFFLNSRSTTSWQRVISLPRGERARRQRRQCGAPRELDLDEEVHGLEEEHLVPHDELREQVPLQRDDHLARRRALAALRQCVRGQGSAHRALSENVDLLGVELRRHLLERREHARREGVDAAAGEVGDEGLGLLGKVEHLVRAGVLHQAPEVARLRLVDLHSACEPCASGPLRTFLPRIETCLPCLVWNAASSASGKLQRIYMPPRSVSADWDAQSARTSW